LSSCLGSSPSTDLPNSSVVLPSPLLFTTPAPQVAIGPADWGRPAPHKTCSNMSFGGVALHLTDCKLLVGRDNDACLCPPSRPVSHLPGTNCPAWNGDRSPVTLRRDGSIRPVPLTIPRAVCFSNSQLLASHPGSAGDHKAESNRIPEIDRCNRQAPYRQKRRTTSSGLPFPAGIRST